MPIFSERLKHLSAPGNLIYKLQVKYEKGNIILYSAIVLT